MIHRLHHALALATLAALAACSSGPQARPEATVAPVPTVAAEIDAIVTLLDAGDAKAARRRLTAVLKREPQNAEAQLLLDSIDNDARAALGPTSYPYEVQPGDTMAGIAQRLLGNRLKFYQLARYNDVAIPRDLPVGRTLRIPGTAPRPAPVARPEPPRPARPAPPPAAAKAKAAAPAAPTRSARNPAAAQQSRAAGLAALNQGNVARAVGLLRRARALDPANALIARDLQRAERIQATVRARKP